MRLLIIIFLSFSITIFQTGNAKPKKTSKINDLFNIGDANFEEGKLDEAAKNYDKAFKLAKKNKSEKNILKYHLKTANLYYSKNELLDVIKNFHKASTSAHKISDHKSLAYIYSRLSYVYFDRSELDLSKTYIQLAIKENTGLKNKKSLAENYYNAAIIYKKDGNLTESYRYETLYSEIELPRNYQFHKLKEQEDTIEYKYNLDRKKLKTNFLEAKSIEIQILNKITAYTSHFKLKVGSKIDYANLQIITRSCWKSHPEDKPDNFALLDVIETKNNKEKLIFKGWMFSADPSLSSLEHPIYDLKIINCYNNKL